jgi:hypothetical protein
MCADPAISAALPISALAERGLLERTEMAAKIFGWGGAACVLISAAAATLVACSGGSDASGFGAGGGPGSGEPGGSTSTPPSPSGPVPSFGNAPDGGGGGDATMACATTSAKAQEVPVYLAFIFDKSGSMADNQKWTTCKAGLESFFSDPKSAGLYASIQFFPLAAECSTATYAAPAVPMTALPSASFATTIETFSPGGGTPTLPAMEGAIQYAQTQLTMHAGAKVAVVLATDGEPNDCNSTVADVSAAAAAVASKIPTYVIGVGSATGNLDAIALAGGTQKAFVVAVGNPAQTATDFQAALAAIRGSQLACEYQLPQPPAGQTLDINNVNVEYTPSSGAPEVFTYDASCSGSSGPGWHYDDPNHPAKIEICPSTCTTIQADAKGSIDILLGCATKGGVTK